MEGQSNWMNKYIEYFNTDREWFQIRLWSDDVYANLEKFVLERTTKYSNNQLEWFVELVYDLSYNPILDE
jgi:hypothetical protein